MTEYYGKPVSTHKFWGSEDNLCVVWKCGLPEEDPVHRHDA